VCRTLLVLVVLLQLVSSAFLSVHFVQCFPRLSYKGEYEMSMIRTSLEGFGLAIRNSRSIVMVAGVLCNAFQGIVKVSLPKKPMHS
jgi:hypothetical protein